MITVLEPGAHRLLGDHLVDREVLADVAQELHQSELPEPLPVVDEEGAGIGEVEERLELLADAGQVLAQLVRT